MPTLPLYIDDQTLRTLERVSRETGRTVEDLAESAISEAACQALRDLPPGED